MYPHKILLVEDNDDLRRIFIYQLHKIGQYEVLEATNGEEALDVVAREPPALVLMNLRLPRLDGWETVRRIRALAAPMGDVPIIALTAYALPGDEAKILAAGCDDYLAKPIVDLQMMKAKIERLLTKGRTVQQP